MFPWGFRTLTMKFLLAAFPVKTFQYEQFLKRRIYFGQQFQGQVPYGGTIKWPGTSTSSSCSVHSPEAEEDEFVNVQLPSSDMVTSRTQSIGSYQLIEIYQLPVIPPN